MTSDLFTFICFSGFIIAPTGELEQKKELFYSIIISIKIAKSVSQGSSIMITSRVSVTLRDILPFHLFTTIWCFSGFIIANGGSGAKEGDLLIDHWHQNCQVCFTLMFTFRVSVCLSVTLSDIWHPTFSPLYDAFIVNWGNGGVLLIYHH